MKIIKVNLVIRGLIFLMALNSISQSFAAVPLPTQDLKRLGESAKTVSHQIAIIRQEYESNMYIVRQIQNGGYASAAGALFGKIENGDYDRYGKIYTDTKSAVEDGADASQNMAMKKEQRQKKEAEKAREQSEKLAKAKDAADQAATEIHEQNTQIVKQSAWSKAYNWIKKNGRTSSNAVVDVANGNYGNALKNAGSVAGGDVGTYVSTSGGLYDRGSSTINSVSNGSSIESILNGVGSGISDAANSLEQNNNKNSQENPPSGQTSETSGSSSSKSDKN